jgi:3-hydroxyacyl-CoA dehydrogenase
MGKCRDFSKYKTNHMLSEDLIAGPYGFNDDEIDPESIALLKRITTEYLQRLARTHRISEDVIATINVVVTPKKEDNSQVDIYIEAADELLDLFHELNIQ